MALNPHLSDTSANAAANAIAALANSGKLELYQGTQPANANGSASGSTLLATLTMPATAFPGGATAGVLTAGTISSVTIAVSGTAQWFRLYESNGSTALVDGSVGTVSGYDMILVATGLVAGATLTISSMTVTVPE